MSDLTHLAEDAAYRAHLAAVADESVEGLRSRVFQGEADLKHFRAELKRVEAHAVKAHEQADAAAAELAAAETPAANTSGVAVAGAATGNASA
jgi:hypothetical protein